VQLPALDVPGNDRLTEDRMHAAAAAAAAAAAGEVTDLHDHAAGLLQTGP